ncbi:putative N-acetyltransferase YvbK [compost metagenome]
MIAFLKKTYLTSFNTLYVGTGDVPFTLDFYKRCGFVDSHRVKDFFVDNYDHPIFEGGIQLRDMVYLKQSR